jgi:hypothetical protein
MKREKRGLSSYRCHEKRRPFEECNESFPNPILYIKIPIEYQYSAESGKRPIKD